MDNQHRKISGYRELSQAEIDLMNEIKALGPVIEAVCNKVDAYIKAQRAACQQSADAEKQGEEIRLNTAEPEKWARWARDSMQANLMYLTRAVAQPTFF